MVMRFKGNFVMLMLEGKGRNWLFIFCGYIVNILVEFLNFGFIC